MDLLTFWKTFWKTFPSAKVVVPIPQNPQKWMMWGKGKLMNSGRREWKVNIAARLHAETYHTHNPLQKEALLATFSVLFVENMPLGLEYAIWLWIQFLRILSYCDILFGMVPPLKSYTTYYTAISSNWMCCFLSLDYCTSDDIADHLWRIRRLYHLEVSSEYVLWLLHAWWLCRTSRRLI